MAPAVENKSIFLIARDPGRRQRSLEAFRSAGYRVEGFPEFGAARRQMDRRAPDAVVAAIDWPASENQQRFEALKAGVDGAPIVALCSPERIDLAVAALRHGAEDYLLFPPDPFELRSRLERILEQRELDSRIVFYQNELSKKSVSQNLEARSPAMRRALDRLLRVAPMRSTVMIYGESGVGKELVARSIHFNSPRRDRPFIALNCAAIPASLIESELFGHERGSFTGAHARARGKFEIAHRGTLFLDEIGEMDLNIQSKLLRVLEEREFMRVGGDRSIRVDVRVIAATNAELEPMVADSRFRQDLYYRLKVVTITVPPLRERRDDLPRLIQTFLEEISKANAVPSKVVTPDAMQALLAYRWPGNVRELKNFLENSLVAFPGDEIRVEDLPQSIRQSGGPIEIDEFTPGTTIESMECELIRRTLEHTGGNRTHAAALLGIGVRTLQRKIRTYSLSIAPKRRRPRRTRASD